MFLLQQPKCAASYFFTSRKYTLHMQFIPLYRRSYASAVMFSHKNVGGLVHARVPEHNESSFDMKKLLL